MSAELLSQLDAGQKQSEKNDVLRRAVYESEEVANRLHMNTFSHKAHDEVVAAYQKVAANMTELEKNFTQKNVRRPNMARYVQEASLEVSPKEMVTVGGEPKLDAFHRLMETLRGMKRTPCPSLQPFVEQAITLVDKCITVVKETALDAAAWGSLPEALLMLLHEVMDMPATATYTLEYDEQLKRMNFEVEECTEQQGQAAADGDMKLTELLYFKKITLQESMVDVFNGMYHALDEVHANNFTAPLKRVHEVHNKGNSEISTIMQKYEATKQRVEADLAKLNAAADEESKNDIQKMREYSTYSESVQAKLKDNLEQQEDCYVKIAELERTLIKLANARTEVVHERVQALEAEQRRRADYENWVSFAEQHTKLLENTLHNIDAAEEVTDTIDEMLCSGCNAIERRMREVEAEIEAERSRVHDERLSHFRGLYLTIGDVAYKKERNMEELEKKIEQAHIQQELAMETFNPKAKEYSQAKKDLVKVKEEMAQQVGVLQEKATLHIEYFRPVEQALIESGKTFVHPVEELQQLNERREQKLLQYHQMMSDEGEEVGPHVVTHEMEEIERMRQSMPRRKPGSALGTSRAVSEQPSS